MRGISRRAVVGGLGAAVLGAAGPFAAPRPLLALTDRRYTIYMITWRGWEDASQGFRDYLERRNVPVDLVVRDCNQNAAAIADFVAEAKRLRPDLVYTWGTTTALTVFGRLGEVDPDRHITDIPSVFNIVSTPVAGGLVAGYDQPRPNLTGALYLVPVETQLRTMGSYGPVGKVGMVYNALEANSRLTVEEVVAEGENQGFRTLALASPLDAGGLPDPAALPGEVRRLKEQGADWLYIPPDSFLNVNRDVLTASARDVGLASFAGAENFIRASHGLVGLVSRYYNVGQYVGYLAEQILVDGRSPGEIPIRNLDRFSLIVNMATAHRLKFYPPLSMLAIAEFV
jgi:putative tryptophan/tyrosine transport system substrate-binding protein